MCVVTSCTLKISMQCLSKHSRECHIAFYVLLRYRFICHLAFIHLVWNIIDHLPLRGYCTPDQFFDCLCIFLKNYNTLVTSKICFLKVTFQGTQLLHWNFTKSSGYWFMVQNMENIDFRTFFAVTSQQWPLLKKNCDFWVPSNISD